MVAQYLAAVVIEYSTSLYFSPTVDISQKAGNFWIIVQYVFKNLNAISSLKTFPTPCIDELIDSLG